MSKYLIAAVAALALVPAAAQAQSGSGSFFGPYAGVQAGWGGRSLDGNTGGIDFDDDRSSFDYGAFVGFDSPLGTSVVAGGEAEIGSGGKKLRDSAGLVTSTVDPRWNYALTGRLGFLANDNVLFYGRAGYGGERLRFTVDDGVTRTRNSEWADGLVVGGGVEFALNPTTSIRGEYRYKDFDGDYNPQQFLVGAAFRF